MKRLLFLIGILGLCVSCLDKGTDQQLAPIISIEEHLEKEGITNYQITASGLYYVVNDAGEGNYPVKDDVAKFHFSASVFSGQVFAATDPNGEMAFMNVGVTDVLAGFEEAITLTQEKSSTTFYIPPNLGYGEMGSGIVQANEPFQLDVYQLEIKMSIEEYFLKQEITDYEQTESGLYYIIDQDGEGELAKDGDEVSVDYEGFLLDGTKFDSSIDRGSPILFNLGAGQVIAGWEEGIKLFKKGGSGRLFIPYELAYGVNGSPPAIEPFEPLIFEITLVDIK